MNDEISDKDKGALAANGEPVSEGAGTRSEHRRRVRTSAASRWRPQPLEQAWFALQERVIWPVQDRFTHLEPERNRTLIAGGAAVLAVGIAIAIAVSSGGSSSTLSTTAAKTPAPSAPLAATSAPPTKESEPKPEPPRETLHGAAPVFSPPSPASKGGEKTGTSKSVDAGASSSEASSSGSAGQSSSAGPTTDSESAAAESTSSAADPTSPASATISSDPKQGAKDGASASSARADVPDGPPAGPAALKVAREFANGFVVYETGGEQADFRGAFAASATPELTKALLRRPPKQPAGVKVPRAKVLNVVAGPSRGKVYEVSVALLRVGVTSELRLEMERIKTAGNGKRVEWRVTNVLG